MRVVETLLVRDEEDILDAHLAFQLEAGVDFVVAIDHESRDGTTEILEAYARDGLVERIGRRGPLMEEEWRTELARLAFAEHGADWVLNADADQFWWPRCGDLHAVLAAVPGRFRAVRSFDRVFVPRPDDGRRFSERMIYRLIAPTPINAPSSTYRPLPRVLHRGDSRVVVSRGSHTIAGADFDYVPHWHPIEVLHFPWRSPTQMARKAGHLVRAFEGRTRDPTAYHSEAFRAVAGQRVDAHYDALALGDTDLERGLESGLITTDTRVRDVLRILAAGGMALPAQGKREGAEAPYAADGAALRDADTLRHFRHIDDLERRIAALEGRHGEMVAG